MAPEPAGFLRGVQGPGDPDPGRLVPATHFVILTHPRSGSNLLVHALRQHPGTRMYGELFQEEIEVRSTAFRSQREMYDAGSDGAAFLAERIFVEDDDDPELLAVGFKLFRTQAREPEAQSAWDYLIDRKDLHVIHLNRDSGLDAFVSYCEAEISGRWLAEPDEPIEAGPPIRIDPERCLEFLDCNLSHRDWVRQAFHAHPLLELSYERHLAADFGGALRDVQAFLGLPAVPVPPPLRKQAVRPLAERVANYAESIALLRHTVHAAGGSGSAGD